MTNTKFRKRALLSSVAMLLVALVALGSATFAWFTDNPVADAAGITGKGDTAQGLIIETDTDGGGTFQTSKHSALLFNNLSEFTMQPAYDAGSHVFLTAPAALSSASGIKTGATWASAGDLDHTTGNGVYHETIFLRTTGAGTTGASVYLTGLSADFDGLSDPMTQAVCVAVYTGTTLVALYKNSATGPIVYSGAAANGTTAAGSGNATVKAFGTGVSTALGTATDSTSLQVEVYVYLDGSDSSVYTDAASTSTLINSITCNFSTVAPT